jgi:hypothetical protein
MASYEGQATYSRLKVGAFVAGVISVILAIVLGSMSTGGHIEVDAIQGVTLSADPDPTLIAAAVIVFVQGTLLALVLWAIGTIGKRVVALGKASTAMAEEPFTRPLPTSLPPAPARDGRPSDRQRTYFVVLHGLEFATARRVRRLIHSHTKDWVVISDLKEPDVVIASRLSSAKAEALRADLEEAGAKVSVEEDRSRP